MVEGGRNTVESKEKKAKDCLLVDKYNVEASEILANEAQHLPISEAVPIYEQLLSTFPTAAKFWKQYVEAVMAANNDDATKQIFSRCLLNCLQIALWRCYIRFIRKVNEKKGTEGQEETRKAFDFMLNYVGSDIASGPVWMEYITFLKSLPATTAQEESQRMTAVRKAYQIAIITPTHHVEQLWKDYENFENSVSRPLAKGLIFEYQPKYNSAKAVYRERKKYVDEIDWNMLAVPPSGSIKEEQQCLAWKRLLAFEKGNPQRIDSTSSNRRVIFTYEQCLMYLYHYPDIWYDYATWHAKNEPRDAAIKVFQRALKALPDSEVLRYAYAELEESRGDVQAAKKVYESLLANSVNATALAHIQFMRFLRRTESVDAARKYFLDARKSHNCTYHVFVAYALMAFCLDKDPKVAHSVFESGMKKFMHEPGYILEYADFLCRLNDDRNVRALFERALSLLPLEESVEVWKRFTQFEQTYGDLASMLKVEQRRKEALSGTGEDGSSTLEFSLQDVVNRYSFMDLWPCSSKDLDYLTRQEWLAKNINKKVERAALPNGASLADKNLSGPLTDSKTSTQFGKIIFPDVSRMVIYDPRQKPGPGYLPNAPVPGLPTIPSFASPLVTNIGGVGTAKTLEEASKLLSPALVAFMAQLPNVEGPSPDVDLVLSILLQSNIPVVGKMAPPLMQNPPSGPNQSAANEVPSSNKPWAKFNGSVVRPGQPAKRKEPDQPDEEDNNAMTQSRQLPVDVFRLRQRQRQQHQRGHRVGLASSSQQTGSLSGGSGAVSGGAVSGEPSGSTE
ncbi:cleavage stimulation factor subunit 77 isoform X1 [Amborella trichopoda]|uniref:Suppressor of forked domain-containing protein n=1 Tax=Amborella trichopoda TaxID=13333 RepID=W1NWJ6_AMBTC|nr:cleavage stimulation factor subunit 77 isoform X1 [Amborella trichopoda]ERM99059.1 hypothetical protein AMTR_s00101p00084550 [Amborella trichopoda]|eukprot:XP_020518481.1 cleavage stimulation factor subunit 77 isoform X1 [Amborella trichopoda]